MQVSTTPHDLRQVTVTGPSDDFAGRRRPVKDDYGQVMVTHDNTEVLDSRIGTQVDVRA